VNNNSKHIKAHHNRDSIALLFCESIKDIINLINYGVAANLELEDRE